MSRIAIMGLGRSGISAGRAALQRGDSVVLVDESEPKASHRAQVDELASLGAEVRTTWAGAFVDEGVHRIVVSPGVPQDHPKLLAAARAGIEVIGEIEFAYEISKAPIVALTGTNGKSTSTVMAYLCLRAAGVDAVLCGNVYGTGYPEVPLSEAAANAMDGEVLVAEVSSFQLEWVSRFRPIAATITNISCDHLVRYRDFEEYAEVKHRVYKRMGPEDGYVFASEDPNVQPGPECRARRVSFGGPADSASISEGALVLPGIEVPRSQLPFDQPYNLQNALSALLLGLAVIERTGRGEPARLAEGLREFRGLRHRMECLGERDGVLVVNNSMSTNPAAVVASSSALDRPQHLLLGGRDKNLEFSPLRDYLSSGKHSVYLFGENKDTLLRELDVPSRVHSTLQEAFGEAAQRAKPGEAIVLAPSMASTDQFEDFRERGEVFRALALEWLES